MKKNSNTKKVVFTILAIIIVASLVATAIIVHSKQQQAEEEASKAQTSISSQDETTQPKDNLPTVVKTEIVDVSDTTSPKVTEKTVDSLVAGGWWYYFDVQNKECYAFCFKDDMNMDLAFFNSENIDGGDAKYYKGTSTYTIDDGVVQLRYLPDALTIKSFDLKFKGNKLFFKDDKLANHEDLSLDYPVGFFMVIDKMQ